MGGSWPEIAEAVEAAGPYRLATGAGAGGAHPAAGTRGARRRGGRLRGFLPVGAALGLAALAMGVAMSGFGASGPGRITQLLLAAPVFVLFGRGFLIALWLALRHRVFGMDSLIGLGAGGRLLRLAGSARRRGGRKRRSSSTPPPSSSPLSVLAAGSRIGPGVAPRRRSTSCWPLPPTGRGCCARALNPWSKVAGVKVGERVRVRPGERVPLDGRIVRGGAAMDESLVTGESVPVERAAPDRVVAGAMNLTGALEIEVTRSASESTLSRIAASVEKAQAEKIPIQRAADRIAGVFVPVVLVLAALTVSAWLVAGSGAAFALSRAVAVLVVACPCALGLAAPIAVLVATGRSARQGILFRSGAALEALAAVRAVGLDKTGTVTAGEPEVVALSPAGTRSSEGLLRAAASAEQGSEHPLGIALVTHARQKGVALERLDRFEALPGRGVSATLEGGARVLVGSERLVREQGFEPAARSPDDGASGRLQAVRDAEYLGSIGFRDRPRPEAAELVRRLAEDRLPAAILSGDEPAAVAATGAEIGIRRTEGGLLPDEKLTAVDRLRAEYGSVAMVGDGINDAPALARADVGIALAEGTEIAREAAEVTLMRADLRLVSVAVRLARRCVRIIRQNLFWAFFYNTAAIPLAAGVFYPSSGALLSPEIAAAAMALSSLAVVGNALRLGRAVL